MPKKRKHNFLRSIEAIFWVLFILSTIYILMRFDAFRASSLLQYVLIGGTLAAVFFYLNNRSLYEESQRKTEELIEKQREINNRQKTLDLVFNNSADGILVLDDEQRIEDFSPGMEKITGYKKEEALGHLAQNLLKFHAEKNSSLLPDLMFTSPQVKRTDPYVKNRIVTKDGENADIEASFALIRENDGKVKSLAVIRDVSYEKALTERDKEFIAVTSHQLNTPLSIIRGYSSLLISGKEGKLSTKQAEFIKEIHSSTEKMVLLTNNLLSISRIEQEKIKLNLEDVNMSDLMHKIIKDLESKAEESKVTLTLSEIDKNLIIFADGEKLGQAIINFMDNAIKYAPGGKVSVEVIDKKISVDIIVSDNGIGIPQDALLKIGEKFYRTQEAINIDNKGTGLGVYIAKTIIEKHGGTLNIESKPKKGTKILINIPKRTKETNGKDLNS
ncbi:MAG: ATP-binding protein [Patescibacteria group bacterium]